MVDIAAAKLGIDRVAIRFKNLIQPGELPYTPGLVYRDGSLMTYDSGDYPSCLQRALLLSGYTGFRPEQEKGREEGHFTGLGIACFVEASGLGPLEGASVRVERTGRGARAGGSPPQGKGHETTLAQICADELGMGGESVGVTLGDTERLSYGTGTFASRTAVVGGNAVSMAARAVKEKAIRIASKFLGGGGGKALAEECRPSLSLWAKLLPSHRVPFREAYFLKGSSRGSRRLVTSLPRSPR